MLTARQKEWLGKLVLIVGGSVFSILLVILVYPLIAPTPNEQMANVDLGTVEYIVGMGDLFAHQPHLVAPPENPTDVLSRHNLTWDEDGFRIPASPATEYEVLALGDSYTEATGVAIPWSDALAAASGLTVRNLGFRGYGPPEEARVMQEYGTTSSARIVIVGFFGGNDLTDARASQDSSEFVLPELARELNQSVAGENETPWINEHKGPFAYPIQLQIDGAQIDMAFFNGYIWRLGDPIEKWKPSFALDITIQSWADIRNASSKDTCVIIAFFPSKPQVYLSYVLPEQRDRVLESVERDFGDLPMTFDELIANRRILNTIIKEAAEQEGLHFVDLLPAFDQAAARGEVLYYTYDTHWNQEGHNLAGQVLADALSGGICDSA